MSVVTFVMRCFSEEEVNTADAMQRLRMAEGLHLNLPPSIELYFQQRIQEKMSYHHNVCTMATDGPNLLHIATPDLSISPSRLYVENMLFALPSHFKDDDEVCKSLALEITVHQMSSHQGKSILVEQGLEENCGGK